jgi:hypothetical protein
MGSPAHWNAAQFGCLTRDSVQVSSRERTALTANLPVPMVSKKADTSAPVEMTFALDVDAAGFAAWQQWWAYDLNDGALPFLIFIPWGGDQPQVRARLVGEWQAQRIDSLRWQIGATMQIDRDTLPRFSGGAHA